MFFAVCLSMIAVIVANPTPADNEGGKILRLEKYCYEKHYKFIASMFFFYLQELLVPEINVNVSYFI
jgi:hypothetical protein